MDEDISGVLLRKINLVLRLRSYLDYKVVLQMVKLGLNGPHDNLIALRNKYIYEVMVILGQKSTHPESQERKLGESNN